MDAYEVNYTDINHAHVLFVIFKVFIPTCIINHQLLHRKETSPYLRQMLV